MISLFSGLETSLPPLGYPSSLFLGGLISESYSISLPSYMLNPYKDKSKAHGDYQSPWAFNNYIFKRDFCSICRKHRIPVWITSSDGYHGIMAERSHRRKQHCQIPRDLTAFRTLISKISFIFIQFLSTGHIIQLTVIQSSCSHSQILLNKKILHIFIRNKSENGNRILFFTDSSDCDMLYIVIDNISL